MKPSSKTLLLAAALSSLCGAPAEAAIYSYTLDQSNENVAQPDGIPYLTVQIEDATYGADANAVKFTVEIVEGAFNPGNNFGIDAFGFNIKAGEPAITASNIVQENGWLTSTALREFSGFGKFQGVVKKDKGNNRLDPLVFWITGVNGDNPLSYVAPSSNNAGEGNGWFSAHVAGYSITGSNVSSAFFSGGAGANTPPAGGPVAAVPLPGAFWLFAPVFAGFLARSSKRGAKV